jgi:8-oxo-dGTP pyrophosphatase MutT (NUDIX family)
MSSWRSRHSIIPAVYIVFRDNSKVLLLKRANTGYHDGDFSMPSGHIEAREPAILAATREAREEVGVDIAPEDLHLVYTQHRIAEEGDHERLNLFFEAKRWRGNPKNAEPHKCSELRWFDEKKLPTNIVPELPHFFKDIAAHKTYGNFDFS